MESADSPRDDEPMKVVHIVAGLLGLLSGAVALAALKGGPLHRRAGTLFAYSMLALSGSGVVLAVMQPDRISSVAGLLAFYLVTTSLLTARRHDQRFHWMDVAAALIGLTAAILGFTFGTYAVRSPTGMLDEQVGAPAFVFGGVALLAVLGDLRMMLGRIQGARRIARHLWRMCFALWIAATSFFLGQAEEFPAQLRIYPLLAAPMLLVFVLMLYWLVRVLFTNRFRRLDS
jgi:uncharacterized membrane protein